MQGSTRITDSGLVLCSGCSFASQDAQAQVSSLQGHRNTFYAGAWCGYGFHEDGIKAAVQATEAMGAQVPWTCRPTSPKVSISQQWFMNMFDKFAKSTFK